MPEEDLATSAARTWPNPFVDRVRLALRLPSTAWVRPEVFDVRGRNVRAHEPELLAAGDHTLTWDGRANDGRAAGQGIYFQRASGPGITLCRRVVRLE